MAEAVDFPGSNLTFLAPEGRDDVGDLHSFSNGLCVVSAWRPSSDELAEINRTGVIFLSVMCGRQFFPSFVGSESIVRSVVVDYGAIW